MTAYLRNPLTLVWALLTVVTVASWLTARDGGQAHHLSAKVTAIVLLIAAFKAQLVIWHFMEVRRAPTWLKVTTHGWLVTLFGLLLGLYFAAA
ncbi:cytochrome C oxidase subunit IV family protein [Mycolicibacterium boenickei]|nr:cytochrome C oxidase subunit IV family protein [Mycolicibacterium boenickei]